MSLVAVGGESFENYAGGIGNLATALALIIGGVWAYQRFRHTPERRPKFTVDIAADWLELDGAPFVRALVIARNDGGRPCVMLWGLTANDQTRLGFYCFGASDTLDPGTTGAYVNWVGLRGPDPSAPLLDEDVPLRSTDQLKRTVLFRPPDDVVAVLVSVRIYLKARRRWPFRPRAAVPYTFSTLVTATDRVESE
jgi:hypothetical protein